MLSKHCFFGNGWQNAEVDLDFLVMGSGSIIGPRDDIMECWEESCSMGTWVDSTTSK